LLWLFIIGVSLELAGAVLVAWTVFSRTPDETREEAVSTFDANLWVVIFREREQAHVRVAFFLLGSGFVLQLSGYVDELRHSGRVAAPFVAIAVFGIALFTARRLAGRRIPIEYAGQTDLLAGLEDERHGSRVRTFEDVRSYRRLWIERVARTTVEPGPGRVAPNVNHGRWVFACPLCGPNHVSMATPALDTVVCRTCGHEYGADFPPELAEIERLLLLRPKDNRNWRPGESVADLRVENAAHGLPQ